MGAAPAPGMSLDQAGQPIPGLSAARTGTARSGVSRRVFGIVGLATSAAAGLGMGYVLYKLFLSSINTRKASNGGTNGREEEPPAKDAEPRNASPGPTEP
jgi:hypothetical protein